MSGVKLLGTVLHQIHYELEGELAWFIVYNTMMEQCEADKTDVGGFADFVRAINGVEVALMIIESGENKSKEGRISKSLQ